MSSAINNSLQKFAHDMKIYGNLRATWKFAIPQFFALWGQIRGKSRISLRAQNREFLGV